MKVNEVLNDTVYFNKFNKYRANKKNSKMHRRQKRSRSESLVKAEKEFRCKSFEVASLFFGATADILNVITSASGAFNVLGVPIGAGTASAAAMAANVAYINKLGIDSSFILEGCDDIPFDEIKEILGERFSKVDEGLDRNYNAIQFGFQEVAREFSKTSSEMQEGFKKIKKFVRESSIETVTSNLITSMEYFATEKRGLQYFSARNLYQKLADSNGILQHLSKFRTADPNTLHTLLNTIVNRKFAVPKDVNDDIAFMALSLLIMGVKTYASVLSFLLNAYNYLARTSHEKSDIEAYKTYFDKAQRTFKEFKHSLNGIDAEVGLIDKIIQVLAEVKELDFIKHEKHDIYRFLLQQEQALKQVKLGLTENHLFIDKPPHESIRYDFTHSAINTPFLEWIGGVRVSYAMQYKKNGTYSDVSEWSRPYTVDTKACPMLDIGTATSGYTRLIFRKFNEGKPQLVGIVEDATQLKFRDISRDLYNVVSEQNTEIALALIRPLLADGANVKAIFEKDRQAIHAASDIRVVSVLKQNGSDINARDRDGYAPIHIAAELGYENLIKDLIKLGAQVNARTNLNESPLHTTTHIETMKSLLASPGIDCNARSTGNFTPLHSAIASNEPQAVAVLVGHSNVDLNMKSTEGFAPIHLAVLSGNENLLRSLLASDRVDVNAVSTKRLTACHLAVIKEDINILRVLLNDTRTNGNLRSNEGWTPLLLCILLKKESVAMELLKSTKIGVNIMGRDSITPLQLASAHGQNLIVSKLIDKHVNINSKDNQGISAVCKAASMGHAETVQLLAEKGGAVLNPRLVPSYTALYWAIRGGHLGIVQYLVDVKHESDYDPLHCAANFGQLEIVTYFVDTKNFDVNRRDDNGHTPLYLAIRGGHLQVVQYLVDAQPDVGYDPLYWAANFGQLAIVKYFVGTKKFDVNRQDNKGDTALHWAIRSGQLEVVKYFVGIQNIDVNLKNKQGVAPLYEAAGGGLNAFGRPLEFKAYLSLELVKYLMQAKNANVNIQNEEGQTPLYPAARSGSQELVQYLVDIANANLTITDKENRTVVQTLSPRESASIIEYLDEIKAARARHTRHTRHTRGIREPEITDNLGGITKDALPSLEGPNNNQNYSKQRLEVNPNFGANITNNFILGKWLLHVLGFRSVVTRMNKAAHVLSDNSSSFLEGNLQSSLQPASIPLLVANDDNLAALQNVSVAGNGLRR